MKKLFIAILTIFISFTLILTTSANGNIYAFERMTIEFSENSSLTPETQADIDRLFEELEDI